MNMKLDLELLIRLYDDQPLTVDCLPHSAEEVTLVGSYNAIREVDVSKRDIYLALLNLRKKSKLKGKRVQNAAVKR